MPTTERWSTEQPFNEALLRLKTPRGLKALFFYPIWWCFVFFWLMIRRWDIAHATNLDTIPPVVIAGKIKRKPVIYDICDVFEDSLPPLSRGALTKIDKLFMRLASSVVLVDDLLTERFSGVPNSKVAVIYESLPDGLTGTEMSYRKNENLTVFYGGVLVAWKGLNLDKFFNAIKDVTGVHLVIAGWGDLVDEIKELSAKMPDKIQFIGQINHSEALQRTLESDFIFVLRSSPPLTNKYICGGRLLEAMMCGKPILVNQGTSTAIKVAQEECGLVVNANDIDEIKRAIVKLRDNPELRQRLGVNARKAFEHKYGWHIMEQRLLDLYQGLLTKEAVRNL